MKLRYLATVVVLALTTVAAFAQSQSKTDTPAQGNVGIYLNPIFTHVSNSYADSGPYAFLGQNSTSKLFYGYNLGGYYTFMHSTSLDTSFDMRFADLHANNGMLRDFMVGLRVSGHPFARPIKPYVQASVGLGTTKAPEATVHVSKATYGIFGGVDYTLARHVDFRVLEVGYGSLTTISSGNVGAGGTVAVPAAKLLSFSSGLVFRF